MVTKKDSKKMFEYRGCGRAWAAVKDDYIIALLYMTPPSKPEKYGLEILPPAPETPVSSLLGLYPPDAARYFNLCFPPRAKKTAYLAAADKGFISLTTRSGAWVSGTTCCRRLRAVLNEEDRAVEEWQKKRFELWREYARKTLAKYGEVISGMCSCWEFIGKNGYIYKIDPDHLI